MIDAGIGTTIFVAMDPAKDSKSGMGTATTSTVGRGRDSCSVKVCDTTVAIGIEGTESVGRDGNEIVGRDKEGTATVGSAIVGSSRDGTAREGRARDGRD